MEFVDKDELFFKEFFLLKEKRQFKKALILLSQLEKIYEKSSLVYGLYGAINYELKNYKESSKYFKKVIAINPKSETASLGLFHSFINLSKPTLALKELVRYSELKKPELYLVTIKELMENIEDFELVSNRKMIQNLFNKWCGYNMKKPMFLSLAL